jgi:hypothetical protein
MKKVTSETFIRAETDKYSFNISQQAGGVNKLFHFRNVTPLDKQTVIRMNKDTLYSMGVVDTSGGATITIGPERPADVPESNFIYSNPNEGWFTYFRTYAPTEAYFDKTWKLDDLKRIK